MRGWMYNSEVVYRGNTQMFNKKFIIINNHQSTIYTIHNYD